MEDYLESNVKSIVESMVNNYNKNTEIVEIFKKEKLNEKINIYNKQEKLIEPIKSLEKFDYKIGGVDAGFVNKQFNFANITIIKEVGALFSYKDFKLESFKYYPDYFSFSKPYLTTSTLELEEVVWNTSILRLNKENDVARNMILENNDLDFMLLDGSIVPQYLSKPSEDSVLFENYNKMIEKFKDLYYKAKENKVFLIGCIEDSRSNSFFKFLKENSNKKINFDIYDSFFVYSLLEKGYRTCAVKYTDSFEKHPILKDFDSSLIENLYVCYLKVSELDYPLRIEFIYFKEFGYSLKEYTEKIASVVSYLSSFNRKYVYPSVLVEADIRSRLRMDEIDSTIKQILDRTKAYGFRLPRRESRMF